MPKNKVLYSFTVMPDMRKIDVTADIIHNWNKYQEPFTGLRMTDQQMLDLILTDKVAGHELLMEGIEEEFVTEQRERFMDMLANKLLNRNWPTYDEDGGNLYNKSINGYNKKFSEDIFNAVGTAGYLPISHDELHKLRGHDREIINHIHELHPEDFKK